ncbi:hypothetical protein BDN70DRAFT_881624 [Pholiota conissans]|uniref:Uncharacterized protein n=1 Tax=Pholiota conissans TaxID=109636 RepID=A0A9P5YWH9_9AGAR|nr:hypothetical protein BDN70DRAFT_881624 [Pholiota conissans]
MTYLPLDVVDSLMDVVAEEDDPNLSTMKACSLVCFDFHSLCRKRIFARIVLNDTYNIIRRPKHGWRQNMTTSKLYQLLSVSPEIGNLIRDLYYYITDEDEMESAHVLETFNYITRLDTFAIETKHQGTGSVIWTYTSLRPALLHLLHLPTLVNFNMRSICEFAFKDLANSHIKNFSFSSTITISPFPDDVPDSSIKLRRLIINYTPNPGVISNICNKICVDQLSIIDFGSLEELSMYLMGSDSIYDALHLVSRCEQLVALRLFDRDLWSPNYMSFYGFSKCLHPLLMRKLKHLEIHIRYGDDNTEDRLHCLPEELEKMANETRNPIEQLTIEFFVEIISGNITEKWDRFDRAFGTGWPNLRRFTLVMSLSKESTQRESRAEEVLLSVQETQFPRLSSRKSMVFDFLVQKESDSSYDWHWP